MAERVLSMRGRHSSLSNFSERSVLERMFSWLCFLWMACAVTVVNLCGGDGGGPGHNVKVTAGGSDEGVKVTGGGSGPFGRCAGSDVLCLNNGVCKKGARGSYTCECPEGYSGKLCQIVGTPRKCALGCRNEGVCQVEKGHATCACPDGFNGRLCENEDIALRCSYFDCYNGGQCKVLEEVPVCKCTRGFTGSRCEYINYCEEYICYNSGMCRNERGGPTCACPIQFKGKQCELIF